MKRDFVSVKIDIDRMELGEAVGRGLRAGHSGGIPWFLFLDPSKTVLRVKPNDDSSAATDKAKPVVYQRRKAAVLATSDGLQGTVGCPMTKDERAHFITMLRSANLSFTESEIQTIAEELHAYAREVIGKDADR
jgi:hypothetical protein